MRLFGGIACAHRSIRFSIRCSIRFFRIPSALSVR
jgi:hypothetical protein